MKAIEAYKRMGGGGDAEGIDYEGESWFEALSPNEMALFQNLAAGQIAIETAVTIAERLDMGGICLDRSSLFEQHEAALKRCKANEEAQEVQPPCPMYPLFSWIDMRSRQGGATKLSIRSVDSTSSSQLSSVPVEVLLWIVLLVHPRLARCICWRL